MRTDGVLRETRLGSRRVAYLLRQSGRRRLRIAVEPDLRVVVDAPATESLDAIEAAVARRAAWIVRWQERMAEHHPLPSPRRYVSGETLVYLGRQYRLRVERGEPEPPRLRGAHLFVRVRDPAERDAVRVAVEAWYGSRARDMLSRHFEVCVGRAARHAVPRPRVVLRRMERRWGSCSRRGCVTLNAQLVCVPVHCIDYVILHELCHLVHHDHSKAFRGLLMRLQPDWAARKAVLEGFRPG